MAMPTQKQTSSGNGPSPNIFMQEDEIPYWLHHPLLDDNSLQTYVSNNDLLYTTPPFSAPPYLPPPVGPPVPSSSTKVTPEVRSSSTIVASHTSEYRVSRVSDKPAPISTSGAGVGAGTGVGTDIETCEMSVSVSVMSSPGSSGSGESSGMEPSTKKASAEKSQPTPWVDGRKQKLRDTDGDDAKEVGDYYILNGTKF
ncbi:hypothetical protein Hdeb2414_s0007g00229641 [Helianthus debilis subsp. tardiflorus]